MAGVTGGGDVTRRTLRGGGLSVGTEEEALVDMSGTEDDADGGMVEKIRGSRARVTITWRLRD